MNAVCRPALASALLSVAALLFAAPGVARADVWACKDKEGVVRFADRKLPGFRCVLYAKTPGAPKADTAAGGSPVSAPAPAGLSKPRAAARYATVPPPTGRWSGDEPDDLADRERLYAPYIEEAAALYDIPEAFVRAVIRVESAFRYRATSPVGAQGLMQLMPSAQKDMGVQDPWDPRTNVLGGTRLLRVLADRFDGDMVKVLAAYHAGSGAVNAADGIPYEATESYVRSVLDRYYEYRSRQE